MFVIAWDSTTTPAVNVGPDFDSNHDDDDDDDDDDGDIDDSDDNTCVLNLCDSFSEPLL